MCPSPRTRAGTAPEEIDKPREYRPTRTPQHRKGNVGQLRDSEKGFHHVGRPSNPGQRCRGDCERVHAPGLAPVASRRGALQQIDLPARPFGSCVAVPNKAEVDVPTAWKLSGSILTLTAFPDGRPDCDPRAPRLRTYKRPRSRRRILDHLLRSRRAWKQSPKRPVCRRNGVGLLLRSGSRCARSPLLGEE